MKKNISILLIAISILIVFSTLAFALENVEIKDYIKGKFPVIFNIYLASLGELDQDEREFVDLLQALPEEDQKRLAKEVYENGFSEEILEDCRGSFFLKEEEPEPEIEEEVIDTGKWIYSRGINPMSDKLITTFKLKCEKNESNEPIFLIIKKEGKKTIVFIDWNRELRPVWETTITVWTRFDDNKVSSRGWDTVSSPFKFQIYQSIFGKQRTSSQYTFYSGREIKFIKKLMSTDRFVAELRSFSKMSLTAIFDVRGLRDAIGQFNDILQWIKD